MPGTWAAASSTAQLWAGIISKIGHFASVVNAIGDIHPYLKAATSVINAIVQPIVTQDARDEKFEELLKEMQFTYDHVIREPGTISQLRERPLSRQTELIKEICSESEKCVRFIQEEYIGKFWIRAAKNTFNGGEVDKKIKQFESSFSGLRDRWQAEILHHMNEETLLSRLSPMRHAGHTTQRACHPDTRIAVLQATRQWIDSPASPRVLFLLGVAGCGKTSIANTVADRKSVV